MTQNNAKKIELKDDFVGVVLSKSETGRLIIDVSALKDADVTVITNSTIQLKTPLPKPANDIDTAATVTKQAYNIGDVLPDGWVVGPRSPKTGLVMAIEPASGALNGCQSWDEGEDHSAELRGKGYLNARQPSANSHNDELCAIYNEIVKTGRNGNAQFYYCGLKSYGTYWSGTTHPDNRYTAGWMSFDNGHREFAHTDLIFACVRCVRDEPNITLA